MVRKFVSFSLIAFALSFSTLFGDFTLSESSFMLHHQGWEDPNNNFDTLPLPRGNEKLPHSLSKRIDWVVQQLEQLSKRQQPCGAIKMEEGNTHLMSNVWRLRFCVENRRHFSNMSEQWFNSNKGALQKGMRLMDEIIYGGPTKGLLAFFRDTAWNEKQHWFIGSKVDPVENNMFVLTILGVDFLDRAKGFGASWNLWQQIKIKGGYDDPVRIMEGSLICRKNNGMAINLLRCLINDYKRIAESEMSGFSAQEKQEAAEYVRFLQVDHDALYQELATKEQPNWIDDVWLFFLYQNQNIFRSAGEYTSLRLDGSVPEGF